MMNERPTYGTGFARNAAESAFPELWRGLRGLWAPSLGPTGGVVDDWGGIKNPGILTGPTWEADALNFVASDPDYVLIDDAPYGFSGWTEITVGAWTTAADIVTANTFDILSYWWVDLDPVFLSNGWVLAMQPGSTRYFWQMSGKSLVGGGTPISERSLIVGTYDGTTMRLYQDGEEVGSSAETGNVPSSNALNVVIGSQYLDPGPTVGSNPWDGKIDVAFIYDRGLAHQEVTQWYESDYGPLLLEDPIYGKVPVVAANDLLLLQNTNLRGNLQDLRGGLR